MYDMTIRLRTDGSKCLYEQIYEHIRTEIRDGKLLAGERLPSTRSLAEYLQVARSTVDYAYGQLLDEGYIESRPCKGYFVCRVEEFLGVEEAASGSRRAEERSDLSCRQRKEAPQEKETDRREGAGQTTERQSAWDGYPEIGIDFSPHEIDMSGFPFSVWRKITGNIMSDANTDLFSRGEAQGDYELRKTICRYLHSSRGVNCEPQQVIVGAGNDYLLLLLEKLLGRHVRVAMEDPTYIRSYQLFRSFAYPVVRVGTDEAGMQVEQLKKEDVRVAYVMPSHQFPLGSVMPIGRRLELLKWADGGEDRYLIEDDYDSEFRFHGKPIPALQSSDECGRVIYIGSFSKAIAPAIRVSFMVLPPALLEKYKRDCAFYSCTVSRIDQSILNQFIRDGYFERHLNKMRKIYRGKHNLLLELLKPFGASFVVSGENAGLHLLLTAKGDVSEEWLVRTAAEKGVKVYGLSAYMVDREKTEENAAVLLGFGGLSTGQLTEGVRLLQEAWR